MNRDEYNLIVQASGDGGDTAQRMGMYGLALTIEDPIVYTRYNHLQTTLLLEVAKGTYVRHPFQPGFRSDPKQFSRDQHDAVVIYLGACNAPKAYLYNILINHFKRLGKYQNADFMNLTTIGVYARALKAWWLYPLLCFTDLIYILNPLFQWVSARNNPADVDDNNAIMRHAQAATVMPTIGSWLGRKVYRQVRPKNYGCSGITNVLHPESYDYNEINPIMGALVWYHRKESGGNPDIAEAYRPIIEKYFN